MASDRVTANLFTSFIHVMTQSATLYVANLCITEPCAHLYWRDIGDYKNQYRYWNQYVQTDWNWCVHTDIGISVYILILELVCTYNIGISMYKQIGISMYIQILESVCTYRYWNRYVHRYWNQHGHTDIGISMYTSS